MAGQDPNGIGAGKPISANAESPEHGLRILARIIARTYVHDTEFDSYVNRELNDEMLPGPEERVPGGGP